jgi:hypothetical protein
MLKTYEQYVKEKNDKGEPIGIKMAFEAAQKNAIEHFEEENVATLEYATSVLRRTAKIDFETAVAICELADSWPEEGARFPLDWYDKVNKMAECMSKVMTSKEERELMK